MVKFREWKGGLFDYNQSSKTGSPFRPGVRHIAGPEKEVLRLLEGEVISKPGAALLDS
jgi:hypothetical protein